ncbi:amidohydrolase family protein [Pseudorhodoplanes sinuspersici]|uniref:amidohydrolase family protein n=1 Tax=Pseudorhodoplanes sinuspersici TaxID=1235591 RepID=UPI001FD9E233|nr:amidohydrolase family protein [Pseudorhodoplanes sinuspersici]
MRGCAGLNDIAICDGLITAIAPSLALTAERIIEADGRLVTESFANPHLHLCKVWTLTMMEDEARQNYHGATMEKAMAAIEVASRVKERYAESWIVENARRAVALAALYGNLHIRAFADVDGKARLEGLNALLKVRDEFRGIVDVQVVAFPQDGILREPGTRELMREAMIRGADVVGGIPWIEYTDKAAAEHISFCFDLAQEFDKDVSMLLDDAGDPGLRTLETFAIEAAARSWTGRTLAHHCRAMSQYPKPYLHRLIGTLLAADISIVSDPHTGPLHACVQELLAEKVNVCLGQDDISDAYYPYGRNNMLEVVFLASHLLWMMARDEIEQLYDLVTVNAGKAINVPLKLAVGSPAHMVVLSERDVLEAVRFHSEPACVISHGRLVDLRQMRELAGLRSV